MPATNIQYRDRVKAHHHSVKLMGCHFVLTAVDTDPHKAWEAIRAGKREIERIENLISSWKPDTQTSQINDKAGVNPICVDRELFELISRSLKISEMTAGAFDISGTLARYYWNFNNEENEWLPEKQIHELRDLINYQLIKLNRAEQTVFLQKKGMKIGFGGIGKGYAAYRAHVVMKSMGIQSGLINASGDLMSWGQPPNKENWTINIPSPQNKSESLLTFSIPFGSIVTSGNYEQYTILNGKQYSHIVDPRTGLPVKFVKNVSVLSPNPEFGDALATAITVMGPQAGVNLVNRLNGVECLVIDKDDKLYFSNQFKTHGLC